MRIYFINFIRFWQGLPALPPLGPHAHAFWLLHIVRKCTHSRCSADTWKLCFLGFRAPLHLSRHLTLTTPHLSPSGSCLSRGNSKGFPTSVWGRGTIAGAQVFLVLVQRSVHHPRGLLVYRSERLGFLGELSRETKMTLPKTLPAREVQLHSHLQILLKSTPEVVFSPLLQAKACLACVLISFCLKETPPDRRRLVLLFKGVQPLHLSK